MALPAMHPRQLHVLVHDSGKVFTSLTSSSLPATIPDQSLPDEEGDMKMLTTQWAYETRPWYPLVPSQPVFDGPIFSCLNHSFYLLDTELLSNNRYRIHPEIGLAWEKLEKQLIWCQKCLGHGIDVPWAKMARSPCEFRYSRSQVDAKMAKKVALRSRDAFLGIAAVC
ncbi:hypothetical protein BDR05DRAFT_1006106 [Suillus weaverae]|nr:hypothetical protein BDR05DRAFT_1006106 [Suillus weaverae]